MIPLQIWSIYGKGLSSHRKKTRRREEVRDSRNCEKEERDWSQNHWKNFQTL